MGESEIIPKIANASVGPSIIIPTKDNPINMRNFKAFTKCILVYLIDRDVGSIHIIFHSDIKIVRHLVELVLNRFQ